MSTPIPAEKAEELILHYLKLRYQLIVGEVSKIEIHLQQKANELGFSRASAWKFVRFARDIGMVESKIYEIGS